MDASIAAGRPVGIGSSVREDGAQERLFLARHHEVATGGCCAWNGKRWALNKGMAHAAPPGRSYHERCTPDGKCLAIDAIGDLKFLAENCAAYGLNEASGVNNEPWHVQPAELPRARRLYVPAIMHPLKPWPLPEGPPQQARRVLKFGMRGEDVRAVQMFLGVTPANGFYFVKTRNAVTAFQQAHALPATGVVDAATWAELERAGLK